VVADALERAADGDERLRLLTVTAVEVSPDLRHATVYLSSLADEAAEGLAQHRVQLQQAIGREVRMKRTPQLTFAADPGVAAGTKVEEILRHLHEREPGLTEARPGAEPETPGAEPETPGAEPETPGAEPETPGAGHPND
jgi:ribosome-binding factor A